MSIKEVEAKILSICKEIIDENGFLLIEFKVRGQKPQVIFEIFVDKKGLLSLDDCADLSRKIGARLEEKEIELQNFRLDVSSPGTERDLVFLDQYYKHTERTFELEYKNETENTIRVKAKLLRIENNMPVFQVGKEDELSLTLDSIISAKVLVRF